MNFHYLTVVVESDTIWVGSEAELEALHAEPLLIKMAVKGQQGCGAGTQNNSATQTP